MITKTVRIPLMNEEQRRGYNLRLENYLRPIDALKLATTDLLINALDPQMDEEEFKEQLISFTLAVSRVEASDIPFGTIISTISEVSKKIKNSE